MADIQPERVFRFGPFEADLRNRQLLKNGLPVSLRGQPFDVLALLLEHPGQLVTREQLRARLWPSGTVVEFEHSIHTAVTKLREALGENAELPSFIATVPRHGYRFIASTLAPTALEAAATARPPASPASGTAAAPDLVLPHALRPLRGRLGRVIIAVLAVLTVALGYVLVDKLGSPTHSAKVPLVASGAKQMPAVAADASATGGDFKPPLRSIGVLPFVNLSGDKEQEYLSDGLTEELLSALSRINELQVAAQTSSFYFKGKDVNVRTIARELNVGSILEGSIRRSGHTVRITAQLINGVTGFHLWSKTYDRDLGDVLKLQTEIATAVARALKVTLLGDVVARIELGGTRNPAAFDAYLRGAKAVRSRHDGKGLPTAVAAFTEAIRLDPHYALAFAARSLALATASGQTEIEAVTRGGLDKAQDARRALALAPDLAEAHLALAFVSQTKLDFTQASEAYESALALAPGNALVLALSGRFAALMGHFDAGLAATHRAVVLDPLGRISHSALGRALYTARRYGEAIAAFAGVISLDPGFGSTYGERGAAYYALGDLQRARASCETMPDPLASQWCLALTYAKLGQHADAEAMLAKMKASEGDSEAYQYAEIYAQWGDRANAIEWLEAAFRRRGADLAYLKTDPLIDPLRQEPRFRAIERELKFPD
jgi:TolB-like protein/DNA-binding winged helix-turn-helix (wHTH) protein/tetratricopeptide (TPR) repeat protein